MENIDFGNSQILNIEKLHNCRKDVCRNILKNRLLHFWKILNMGSISFKKHALGIADMGSISLKKMRWKLGKMGSISFRKHEMEILVFPIKGTEPCVFHVSCQLKGLEQLNFIFIFNQRSPHHPTTFWLPPLHQPPFWCAKEPQPKGRFQRPEMGFDHDGKSENRSYQVLGKLNIFSCGRLRNLHKPWKKTRQPVMSKWKMF